MVCVLEDGLNGGMAEKDEAEWIKESRAVL